MGYLPSAEQEELAANVHQIHGGIGVTAEHDAHLYHRRAQSSNPVFGGATDHRRRLAERLLPACGGTP